MDSSELGGRRFPAGLVALTLASLVLRAFDLARFELWVDEAATWHFAHLTASGRLLEQIALEPTPPLYYGLIGALMRVAGESDLVMRWPSVIFGAAGVPAVFLLGRELVSRRAGWIAAVLLAIHPLHVFYSREARVYPLLLVLSVLLWLVLWRALDGDGGWRSWLPFGAVLAVACYSHLFGLFLGATAGVLILVFAPGGRARLRGLAVAAAVGLLFAPYLLLTLPHLKTSGAAWSVERIYDKLPKERRFGRSLELGMIGAGYHLFLREISQPPTPNVVRWPALLANVGLLAAAYAGRRRSRTAARRQVAFRFLVIAWILPIFIPWTLNHWHVFFQTGRHDFYVVGTLTVLLAAGFDALWRLGSARRRYRLFAAIAVLVLGVAVVHRLYHLHRLPASAASRQAGDWIARHAAPPDRVIATGIRRLVTEHYARLGGSAVVFESFPRSTDEHPGWSHVEALLADEPALHHEGRERVAGLQRELDGGRLFVLLRPYERTATAISETWFVDRHLVQNLRSEGWSEDLTAANADLQIAVFRPPAEKGMP